MGVCAVVLAALLHRYGSPPKWQLPLAAAAAAVMAALVEWIQPWFGRTSSVEDFLWGMMGVLGGCLWLGAELRKAALLRLLAVVCVLAPPLVWRIQVALLQAEARSLFPVLADSSLPHLHPLCTIEPPLTAAKRDQLLLARDADHPASIHLDTLDRDWSGYAGLEISGTLQAAAAVEAGVRLDLGEDGAARLQAGGWMQPGASVLQIYWTKDAPTPCVHQLVVFLAANPSTAQLQIHQLRLITKDSASAEAAPAPHAQIINSTGTKKNPPAGLQDARIAQ